MGHQEDQGQVAGRNQFPGARLWKREQQGIPCPHIALKYLIKQKVMAKDVKKAFEVLVEARRELQLLLEVSDNKTETKKEA
jgi:hypothetical protein